MSSGEKTIRIGMIRADKRALWYGAIFDNIDPEIYAVLDPLGYHHMTYYTHVALTHKRACGFMLAKVFDRDINKAHLLAEAFGNRPCVCQCPEEVSDGVDLVFIANESGDGSDHLHLAAPGLRKGIPTFIDRPLSDSLAAAQALVRLARQKKTPLLSCSHLRFLPHVQRFRLRFGELDQIERGSVHGHGPNPPDIADGVELALALFGDQTTVATTIVHSRGDWPLEMVLLTLCDANEERKIQILIVNARMGGERHAFHASAASNMRQIFLDDIDLFIQAEGGLEVMHVLRQMVQTRKPPLPYREMLRTVAIAAAGRKIHNRVRPENIHSAIP